jgi:2-polyprenyl-3-methyl-5-hydroxy-6-metoxy-1,4-benzoquinol methylase
LATTLSCNQKKMNTDLVAYYKNRAKEYENIYAKPERQDELKTATSLLQNLFTDKTVFEMACGTGYWTERISETALSVFATDINQSVIDIAKQKTYPKNNVTFDLADIFELSNPIKFDNLFGGFIWSHIKLQDLDHFLAIVDNAVSPGGTIVFIDNNYVEGSNHPITTTDPDGNTFQTRTLVDGTTHLVLKNFPTESFLTEKLSNRATDVKFISLQYYWLLLYNTNIHPTLTLAP